MHEIRPVEAVTTGISKQDLALHDAAQKIEASFLAEMLQAAGLGKTSSHFGGGAGEEQFASFLAQEQATQMAKAGGIGLAEAIFNSLKGRDDAK